MHRTDVSLRLPSAIDFVLGETSPRERAAMQRAIERDTAVAAEVRTTLALLARVRASSPSVRWLRARSHRGAGGDAS